MHKFSLSLCIRFFADAYRQPNAASTRGFAVKAKPQRKSRRGDWLC